jgi:hypothetical protein
MELLANYKTNIAKFGYIKVNGFTDSQYLTLEDAGKKGLIPYELTTEVDFYEDISEVCLIDHFIIFSALQFLIYTGIKKIYMVGSDVSNVVSYKDASIDDTRRIKFIINLFEKLKEFAESQKVKILSINPVGLKGMFTDIFR